MPTKVSERNLLISIAIFAMAISLLSSAKLFNTPVRISEKGIALSVLGIAAVVFAIRFLKKAIVRF